MAKLILRTHGGLGNQLFQIFYANCLIENNLIENNKFINLIVIHDDNYKHKFKLDPSLTRYTYVAGGILGFVSGLRVPKVLDKLNLSMSGLITICNYFFLDGYFQKKSFYEAFDRTVLCKELRKIGNLVSINKKLNKNNRILVHIRLGDFFKSEKDEIAHLKLRLGKINQNVDLITNRDDLIKIFLRKLDGIDRKKIHHIETKKLNSFEVLKLMSTYSHVFSNNSTLAFWACVLSGSCLHIDDDNLCDVYNFLSAMKV